VGDRIKVEIQKSRFQLRDPFIVSVGIYRGMSGMPTRVNVAPVKPNTPVNEIVSKLEEENADVSGDEGLEEDDAAEEEEEEETKEE
jgi:hypothetical protein